LPIRIVLFLYSCSFLAYGAAPEVAAARITAPIDELRRVTLDGNVSPLIRTAVEQGRAPADLQMQHMLLMLRRSAAQQTALAQLLKDQQDPSSPQFHQWLTPVEFGARYGANAQDVDLVTRWLEGRGFRVESVAPSQLLIDFSGTAADVEQSFHTEIHRYLIRNGLHWANSLEPQIPAALSTVVGGIVYTMFWHSRRTGSRHSQYGRI
jgi:hypothetical protein